MQIRAILPALALLAGFLRAQQPAAKPGSIEGNVANAVTGEPVKKAVVTLQNLGPQPNQTRVVNKTALTDAAGHFRFDAVEPGSYQVAADRDGFKPSFQARGARVPVPVAEDQHVEDVSLRMPPLATVEGYVFDDDGDPLIRANVAPLQYSYDQGRKQLTTAGFANTNDRGEFQIANLPPGRYYFAVTVRGPALNLPPRTRWARPEEAYPVTYYPNSTEAGQAMAMDIAAGARIGNVDFRLRRALAHHLRGKVAGISPRAMGGNLRLASASGGGFGSEGVALQEDGSFDQGGIVSGAYDLTFLQQNGETTVSARQRVNVADQDVDGLVLAPMTGLEVSGLVVAEGGAAENMMGQVSLDPVEQPIFFNVISGNLGSDGSFTIRGVSRESYRVRTDVPAGKYVKSIRFGDHDSNSGRIDLTSGVSAPLRIVLGADGGSITGTVQTPEGQPAVEALVTAAPGAEFEDRADLLKQTLTDASGKFEMKDIAPGQYKVFAWEDAASGAVQSAEFRTPFDSRGASVTIGPNSHESVTLTRISMDDMERERSKLP